jgi:hypothetical protein
MREQQEGTYAWEIGTHKNGMWTQIAHGGGKCRQSDNEHVPITSTRMEALGFLRALQHLERKRWRGETKATMDNESTVKRYKRHRDERHKKQWRKPDWDIWAAMRKLDTTRTKLEWVRGHPEKRKKYWEYSEAEKRNVAMDADAEKHYADTETDKPWEHETGPVSIDGKPLTSGIKGALERNVRTRVTMEFIAKICNSKGSAHQIDLSLLKEIKGAETRAGLLTKSLRITHVLWATNEYLAGTGKRESDQCPLCKAKGETNEHLKGHCPDPTIKAIRLQMTKDIAQTVQGRLKESMPDEVWQAIANMWSQESLTEAYPDQKHTNLTGIKCKSCRNGHNCKWRGKLNGHLPAKTPPNPTQDASDSEDDIELLDANVRQCLRDMTKPGARTAWAGWFPKSMAKLLTNYGISAKDAHEMALEIRNTITQGMDSIWRERNSAQHQPKDRREINEKITTAFEKRERLGIDSSPHHSAEDLHKLPFRTKANWLANSEVKIHEREENNKRKTAATKALAEGKSPAWHKGADKGQPHKRQQQKPFTSSKGNSKGKKAQLTVKSPWDNSPMAAARKPGFRAEGATCGPGRRGRCCCCCC